MKKCTRNYDFFNVFNSNVGKVMIRYIDSIIVNEFFVIHFILGNAAFPSKLSYVDGHEICHLKISLL